MRIHPDVYRAAVEGKVDVLQRADHLDYQLTPNQNTVLHVHIRGGMSSEGCVLAMVRRCPSLIWKKNNEDETALHMAAKEGLTEIVRALIDQVRGDTDSASAGANHAVKEMVGMRNKEGGTALHEAVRYGRLDVAKLLIEEDAESGCCKNKAGETPLYMAVRRGFHQLADEILKICQSAADCDGPGGLTALHLAIIYSNDSGNLGEVGTKLLEKIPQLATKRDHQNGWTPLHYAAYFGKVSQAEALLLRQNESQNEHAAYIGDESGKTPLHIAVTRNHVQVMKKIISHCPDCTEMVDHQGCNVLHMAVQARSRKAMEFILNQDWGSNLINGKDENGNTPVHKFASSLSFVPTLLLRHPRMDKMAVNREGMTAADILSSNTEAPLLKGLFRWVYKIDDTAPALPSISNAADGGGNKDKDSNAAAGGGNKDKGSEIRKAGKTHLIVAALVATVAYAAGFTLPGGYMADGGSHRGMAVLAKKATFIAFYSTDGLAMLLSTIAVVVHFFMTLQEDQEQLYRMFKLASYSTLLAMGAMLASFAMAACAVLFCNSGILVILAAAILFLNFSLCYFVYPLLAKLVVDILPDRKGN